MAMGIYYFLSCEKCRQAVLLGKHIRYPGPARLQGFLSEASGRWVYDGRAFVALSAFLMRHEGHPLLFGNDANVNTDAVDYGRAEFDDLFAEAERDGEPGWDPDKASGQSQPQ